MIIRMVLIIFIAFSSLSAMDNVPHSCTKNCYLQIRDNIDRNILGIPNMPFRALIGMFISSFSYAAASVDGMSSTIDRLVEIEEQIPKSCRTEFLFNRLKKKHFYCTNVMGDIIKKSNEKSKIIDTRLSKAMHQFIFDQAKIQYRGYLNFYNPFSVFKKELLQNVTFIAEALYKKREYNALSD